jgi:hypothetical protein
MNLIRNAMFLGLTVGAVSLAACSSDSQKSTNTNTSGRIPGAASNADGQKGTVGFELQLGPGVTLSTVQYAITNPTLAGFTTITGSVDVSGSQMVSFSVTLPVGSGYAVSLSAMDSNSDPCSGGPATFSVVAGQTNAVAINLVCSQTIDGGVTAPDVNVATVTIAGDASLQTTVTGSICAAVSSLVVSPRETAVGNAINLSASGIDPSHQSSDVTLTWAATGSTGSLTGTSGTSTTFNCTAAGTETITVTAAISDGGASCATIGSLSIDVVCDALLDASAPDTGVDTGAPDTGAPDTGAPDTGVDAGPLVACTTAGQTNCVKCQGNETGAGNSGGLCTPTEVAFVNKDIAAGIATAPGDDPAAGCYSCLSAAGCLDDTAFADTNKECGDLTGATNQSNCQATLACILSNACVWGGTHASSHVSTCYCGTAPPSGSCASAAPNGAANGVCDTQIASGNGFAVNDGSNNLSHLTDSTLASGKADQIFQCALSNSCDQCLH